MALPILLVTKRPMSAPAITALKSFHRFLGQLLKTEAALHVSPVMAVALWRDREDTLAAIREGLADIEAGRTRPVEEVIDEMRQKFGLE